MERPLVVRPTGFAVILKTAAFIVVFAALLLGAAPGSAQEPPEHYLEFAGHLFEKGDYFRAVTEAERFLFLSPEDPRRAEADLLVARSHMGLGQYDRAAEAYERAAASDRRPEIAGIALAELGLCLERIDPEDRAEKFYTDLTERPDFKDLAWHRLGWLKLKAGLWEEAKAAFEKVAPDHDLGPGSTILAGRAQDGEELDLRSPAIAGWLSAVCPGAGQIYTGRKTDAALAFSANAVLMYASFKALRGGNWTMLAVLGLAEVAVYGGAIYNAVNGAHIHNRAVRDKFLAELERASH